MSYNEPCILPGQQTVPSCMVLIKLIYCQNPNSTISSIQLSLRLDYILTQRSTPPTHHPPQTQLVYSKLGRADNCPASKQGPSVQVYSHTQTSEATLYYVFAAELYFFPDKRILNCFRIKFLEKLSNGLINIHLIFLNNNNKEFVVGGWGGPLCKNVV